MLCRGTVFYVSYLLLIWTLWLGVSTIPAWVRAISLLVVALHYHKCAFGESDVISATLCRSGMQPTHLHHLCTPPTGICISGMNQPGSGLADFYVTNHATLLTMVHGGIVPASAMLLGMMLSFCIVGGYVHISLCPYINIYYQMFGQDTSYRWLYIWSLKSWWWGRGCYSRLSHAEISPPECTLFARVDTFLYTLFLWPRGG